MDTPRFTRLSDAELRDAWADEAKDFTPWLFDNIDYLGDALGLELEATDIEAAVESYSADIVAKDVRTGERVVIENQLEASDHKHLGQIMTYLAGIEAKSVVWVARQFQEAHRSAIRWLNEHTDDDFAFFAIRLRVVQIGESPFAPVFEMVEQPNNWERTLGRRTAAAESELTQLRQRFWSRYLERHPGTFAPTRHSNVWIPMSADGEVVLSMYVGSRSSGMFLRGRFGTDGGQLAPLMAQHVEAFETALGAVQSGGSGHYYVTTHDINVRQDTRWDELIDWMDAQRRKYASVLDSIESIGTPTTAVGKEMTPDARSSRLR